MDLLLTKFRFLRNPTEQHSQHPHFTEQIPKHVALGKPAGIPALGVWMREGGSLAHSGYRLRHETSASGQQQQHNLDLTGNAHSQALPQTCRIRNSKRGTYARSAPTQLVWISLKCEQHCAKPLYVFFLFLFSTPLNLLRYN